LSADFLLGGRAPALSDGRAELELLEQRTFPGGVVQLRYAL